LLESQINPESTISFLLAAKNAKERRREEKEEEKLKASPNDFNMNYSFS
jgi:hypothetical protein